MYFLKYLFPDAFAFVAVSVLYLLVTWNWKPNEKLTIPQTGDVKYPQQDDYLQAQNQMKGERCACEVKSRYIYNSQNQHVNLLPDCSTDETHSLIIVTDATPTRIGGYCVNEFQHMINYYSLPSDDMPWSLKNTSKIGNADEFEMKNLLFSLLLWEDLILKYKYVEIYTDNRSINPIACEGGFYYKKYGLRVRLFIKHLKRCGGVVHLNPNEMHVHPHKNPELFNELVVPADHLSRRRKKAFQNFMLESSWGHYEFVNHKNTANQISKKVEKLTQGCEGCGYRLSRKGSLKEEFL